MSDDANPEPDRPDPRAARLVMEGELQRLVPVRGLDVRGALQRGLTHYLRGVFRGRTLTTAAGRAITLRGGVKEGWAEPEDENQYPMLSVCALDELSYGDPVTSEDPMKPSLRPDLKTETDPPVQLVMPCEASTVIEVVVWCQDPMERAAIAATLEDELIAPNDDRGGFVLELPFYFGAHAGYMLASSTRPDDGEKAAARRRTELVRVNARVGVYRPARGQSLVQMEPRLVLDPYLAAEDPEAAARARSRPRGPC